MKLYVHLEHIEPSFTFLYQPAAQTSISDLIQAFVTAYNGKHGAQNTLEASQITITNDRRKILAPSTAVDKAAKDKEDLFVTVSTPSTSNAPSISPIQHSSPPSTTPPQPPQPPQPPTPTTPTTTKEPTIIPTEPITTSSDVITNNTTPPKEEITQSTTSNEPTMITVPPPLPTITPPAPSMVPRPRGQPNHPTTTRMGVAGVEHSNAVPEKVTAEVSSVLARGLREMDVTPPKDLPATSSKPTRLEQFPSGVQDWVKESIQISDKTAQQGNFRQAISIHEQILKIVPLHAQSLLRLGELYFAAGRFNLSQEWFKKGATSSPDILFEMGVADSLYQTGEYTEAAKYYLRALQFAENSTNLELKTKVQVLIAKALYKSGGLTERETAMQIVMTILRANEEQVDALYVYGMATKDLKKASDAMRIFLKILVLNPNEKAVKEDLAELLQTESGMSSLLTELTPTPSSAPAYAYIGTFIKEYGAVEESITLYKKALSLKPNSPSYCLNLIHTMEVMGTYSEAYDVIKNFCKQNPSLAVGKLSCQTVYDVIKRIDNLQEHTKTIWRNPEEATNIAASKFDVAPQKGTKPDRALTAYTNDQLDLLAVFATISKIVIYAVGGLDIIPEVIKLVEPAREGRELHLTPVRNEMAYYSCVAQLMLTQSLPLVNYKKVYVCGDSHSLSPGWRTITVKGEKILLQPALVTGLKIWHLRPGTKFFPKANFYNIIKRIPKGSTVILTFGEIDCREGLLVSVDKCRYDDMDEAITHVLNIYMGVIKQLIADYKFDIYVHPPPPVLDPTRKTVKRFAAMLKDRVTKEPNVKFLDIFDALLSPDREDLHAPYKFDGTHLDPCYISLLETALNNLM